jgi:type VI secretion system protein ImpK
MSDQPASAVRPPANNLAYTFQEVLTAILRVRHQPEQVPDAATFRAHLRRLLQTAMQDARTLGYSSPNIQMALLVAVGFLDESVLNLPSGSPVVAEWSRKPLQEELFGGHLAGETVFTNLATLLQQQDSPEGADVLELHCLCLELGYRGRYAFSNGGEIRQLIQVTRAKIERIRGKSALFQAPEPPLRAPVKSSDPVARGLLIGAVAVALLTVGAFAGYELSLSSGASRLAQTGLALR